MVIFFVTFLMMSAYAMGSLIVGSFIERAYAAAMNNTDLQRFKEQENRDKVEERIGEPKFRILISGSKRDVN